MNGDPAEPPPSGSSFINRVVAVSLDQRMLALLLTVLLVAAGVRAWNRLPVDAYPDLSPPLVSITTFEKNRFVSTSTDATCAMWIDCSRRPTHCGV